MLLGGRRERGLAANLVDFVCAIRVILRMALFEELVRFSANVYGVEFVGLSFAMCKMYKTMSIQNIINKKFQMVNQQLTRHRFSNLRFLCIRCKRFIIF